MAWYQGEPAEVARGATAEGAEWAAAWLLERGVRAYVLAASPVERGALTWPVVVPREEESAARRILAEAWPDGKAIAELDACPACTYSLAGLQRPIRCPECGSDLESAREVIGLVAMSERPRREVKLAGVVMTIGVFATAGGLIGPHETRGEWLLVGTIVIGALLMVRLWGRCRPNA